MERSVPPGKLDTEGTEGVSPPDNGTRQRLLAAAAAVLAERGYDGATVTDIARRAGLTTGAIYANFRDKADLLLDLICGVEDRQDSNLSDMRSRADVDPALFLQDTRDWIDPALAVDRALVLEARVACRRDAAVQERLGEIEQQRLATVSEFITTVQHDGVIRPDVDPQTLALFILSIPLGITVLESTGLPLPHPDRWSVLMERVMEAFLAPPAEQDAEGQANPSDDRR